MSHKFRIATAAVLFTMLAACGKSDGPETQGEKPRLDAATECATAFQQYQQAGGNQARYVAACKQDMSLISCAGPARASGFCQRAQGDPAKKALIEEMTSALGAR